VTILELGGNSSFRKKNNKSISSLIIDTEIAIRYLKLDFGPVEGPLQLLETRTKGKHVICWKNYFVQLHQRHGLLTHEQTVSAPTPYSTT
jgi:hypothetical protein